MSSKIQTILLIMSVILAIVLGIYLSLPKPVSKEPVKSTPIHVVKNKHGTYKYLPIINIKCKNKQLTGGILLIETKNTFTTTNNIVYNKNICKYYKSYRTIKVRMK